MAAEVLPKLDRFARVLPILQWLPSYDPRWFRADVIAGMTLCGIRGESFTVLQTVHIGDCLCPGRRFCDRSYKDTATSTNQKITSPGAKSIVFYQLPVVCPDFKVSATIGNHAWPVTAAK